MRIAFANWSARVAGGVESYIGTAATALAREGHQVALLHEQDVPVERPRIPLPEGAPRWSVSDGPAAERALAAWRPDVVYVHSVHDPALERRILGAGPGVFFIHQYHGTCISGTKTFTAPLTTPCHRRFGWPCVALFYPRRCGGLSPITMQQDFRRQAYRLETLHRYRLLLTHSEHMREEYLRNGIPDRQVRKIIYPVRPLASVSPPAPAAPAAAPAPIRLLYVARLEPLKGGSVLLDALPLVRARLRRAITLTVVGEGGSRDELERQSLTLQRADSALSVRFTGWLAPAELDSWYQDADLVVMPSLWPEPFGMVGLEAGRFGVPTAAFAVGGIPEWLTDGENGFLAPANPPAAPALADAIVRCLADPAIHARLRDGARRASDRFSLPAHLAALLQAFEHARAA